MSYTRIGRLSILNLTYLGHGIYLSRVTHREQIAEASRKVLELERELQRIQKELAAWNAIKNAHETLANNNQSEKLIPTEIGFTEAIRVILGKHPDGLTPTALRDKLVEYGVACGSEKNFIGNIHTVLKRTKDFEKVDIAGGYVFRLKKDATSVKRSRGASGSFDSGFLPGYGLIPPKKKG
jgi:hypothetical protein